MSRQHHRHHGLREEGAPFDRRGHGDACMMSRSAEHRPHRAVMFSIPAAARRKIAGRAGGKRAQHGYAGRKAKAQHQHNGRCLLHPGTCQQNSTQTALSIARLGKAEDAADCRSRDRLTKGALS